ncbi:conjugative transfer ATPase [Photobacterium kishitanii]|uniref:conjugative transfer ATPase n=1 Tax=Photobacterium kishitanii TaxID=318456 RepID=UPI000D16C2D0|nr:conjugative transfer ATPase [Photobacterium kishitanii]PSW46875.1 conjugative transfer ATPase [Photobacterium kishitanii]
MGILSSLFGIPSTENQIESDRNETLAPNRWQIVTDKTIRKHYKKNPHSFSDLMSVGEYVEETQTFELTDLKSHAVVLNITSIPTEGRSDDELVELRQEVINAFSNTFSKTSVTPFIMQTYMYKEESLNTFLREASDFIKPVIRDTEYTQQYLSMMDKHFKGISKPGGIFFDERVTKSNFRGQIKRAKLIIYRNLNNSENSCDAATEINDLAANFISQLSSTGIKASRDNGQDFQQWLTHWFNPKPLLTNGDIDRLDDITKFPDALRKPLGYSIADNVVYGQPISDPENRCWYFDGIPHQFIRVATLQVQPLVGQITGEIGKGTGKARQSTALIDSLPDGTIWHQTIVFSDSKFVDQKIMGLKGVGKSEAKDAIGAENAISSLIESRDHGANHYMSSMGMFIRADSNVDPCEYMSSLKRNRDLVQQLLLTNGLRPMDISADEVQVESYIPHLPMNYSLKDDPFNVYMGLYYDSDVVNLLPIWGRETGTKNLGMINVNRGGEPQCFDMFGKDKVRSSHCVLIGPQGSGKSATMVAIAEALMAVHRPRLTIIEKGNSFRVLGEHFARYELNVQRIPLGSRRAAAFFCPYLESNLLFDERYKETDEWLDTPDEDDEDDEDSAEDEGDSAKREPMTEMLTATIIMITGGEPAQAKLVTETHKALLQEAIEIAARNSLKLGQQTITSDVCNALESVIDESNVQEVVKDQMRNYLKALTSWTTGDRGRLFNRRGKTFNDDSDVTIIDIGQYDAEAKSAELSVIYIALSTHLFNLGEKYQNSGRDTVLLQDETHVFTDKPLLAPYMATAVKLMRKLGLKALYATQNVGDFKNGAEKILKLVEWWILLNPEVTEIEEASNYRILTTAQKEMILSCAKLERAYTEGVIMGNRNVIGEMLTRFVPPSEVLARAMTDTSEKTERREIREKYKFSSDIEAAEYMAYQLDVVRNIVVRDDDNAVQRIKAATERLERKKQAQLSENNKDESTYTEVTYA